ncbi:hypothetical protein DMUE_2724 [Dictyocoela muelleri]|nr:hypothetical protein DMUE_2724 [Dictyocoela muelleri]
MYFLNFLIFLISVLAESDCKVEETKFNVEFIHGSLIMNLSKAGVEVYHEGMNTYIKGHREEGYSTVDKICVDVVDSSKSSALDVEYTNNLEMKPVDQFKKGPLVFDVVVNGTEDFLIHIRSNTVISVTPCDENCQNAKKSGNNEGKTGNKCVIKVITPEVDQEVCVCEKIQGTCYCADVKPGLFEINEKIHGKEVCNFLEKFDEATYSCTKKWVRGIKRLHEYILCQELREKIAEMFTRKFEIYPESSESNESSPCEIKPMREGVICVTKQIVSMMKASVLCEYLFKCSAQGNTCPIESIRKVCLSSVNSLNTYKIFELILNAICYHAKKNECPEFEYICTYEPCFKQGSPICSPEWHHIISKVGSDAIKKCVDTVVSDIYHPSIEDYKSGSQYTSGGVSSKVCDKISGEYPCVYTPGAISSGYTSEYVDNGYKNVYTDVKYVDEKVGYNDVIPDFEKMAEEDYKRENEIECEEGKVEFISEDKLSASSSAESDECESTTSESSSSDEKPRPKPRRRISPPTIKSKGSSNMGMILSFGAGSVVAGIIFIVWMYLM